MPHAYADEPPPLASSSRPSHRLSLPPLPRVRAPRRASQLRASVHTLGAGEGSEEASALEILSKVKLEAFAEQGRRGVENAIAGCARWGEMGWRVLRM